MTYATQPCTSIRVLLSSSPLRNRLHCSFEELLRRSREEDLSAIEETACLYRAAGYDKQGRAVIVFIGKWFRQSQVSSSCSGTCTEQRARPKGRP